MNRKAAENAETTTKRSEFNGRATESTAARPSRSRCKTFFRCRSSSTRYGLRPRVFFDQFAIFRRAPVELLRRDFDIRLSFCVATFFSRAQILVHAADRKRLFRSNRSRISIERVHNYLGTTCASEPQTQNDDRRLPQDADVFHIRRHASPPRHNGHDVGKHAIAAASRRPVSSRAMERERNLRFARRRKPMSHVSGDTWIVPPLCGLDTSC